MKIYAVKKGRVPGVYRNWDETKKQVDGFSGAEYKSFENITDAIDYLGWQEKSHEETINRKDDTLENAIEKIKHNSKKPVKATKNKKTKSKIPNLVSILRLLILMAVPEIPVFIRAATLKRQIRLPGPT